MSLANLNKQMVTFSALAVLFLGSFFYLISVAFENQEALEEKQNVEDYLESL